MDISEVRKRKRPNTRTVRILLEPDLRVEYDEVARELSRAERLDPRTNEPDRAPALSRRLEELQDRIDESMVPFKFKALPRVEFLRLVEDAPPRPDDIELGLDYNPDDLAAPLIAACAVEPEMTLSDAEAIVAEWGDAEVTVLFVAAMTANKEVRDVPFTSRGYEQEDTNTARRSNIAPVEESRTASS